MFTINQTAFPPVVAPKFSSLTAGNGYRVGMDVFRKCTPTSAYSFTANNIVSVSADTDVVPVNLELVVTAPTV